MIDTIQDDLRSFADNNSSEGQDRAAGSHCMHRAAERIDDFDEVVSKLTEERNVLKCQNALLELAVRDSKVTASEWLTLPWGGVVRKSEVLMATADSTFQGIVYVVTRDLGPDKCPCKKGSPEQAQAWLADIEGQLGVKR